MERGKGEGKNNKQNDRKMTNFFRLEKDRKMTQSQPQEGRLRKKKITVLLEIPSSLFSSATEGPLVNVSNNPPAGSKR